MGKKGGAPGSGMALPGCPTPHPHIRPLMPWWFLPKQVQRALLQAEPWRARPAPLPPTSGALPTPPRGATSLGAARPWTSPSIMMRRVCGVLTLSRASRRPWPSTRPAVGARLSCRTKARCTVRRLLGLGRRTPVQGPVPEIVSA